MAKTDETKPVAKKPKISVLERRLQNPFGQPSAEVQFKDTSLVGRWFNGAKQADHIWRYLQSGWSKTTPDMIADLEQLGGYGVSPDGYVVRGERQQEYLLNMPRDWYIKIQHAKAAKNDQMMRSPGAQKANILNAAAGALGDNAAELMNKAMVIGEVRTTREIVQRDKEAE